MAPTAIETTAMTMASAANSKELTCTAKELSPLLESAEFEEAEEAPEVHDDLLHSAPALATTANSPEPFTLPPVQAEDLKHDPKNILPRTILGPSMSELYDPALLQHLRDAYARRKGDLQYEAPDVPWTGIDYSRMPKLIHLKKPKGEVKEEVKGQEASSWQRRKADTL